jgi:hypothetical protein
MIVSVLGSGQNETMGSEPLRANITVKSSLRGRSDLFAEGTSTIAMEVEVTINALVVLLAKDIRVQVSSGNDLQADGRVVAGDKLSVTAHAADYERMEIRRAGLLIRALITRVVEGEPEVRSIDLQHDSTNVYRGEVPSSWLDTAAKYTLCICSSSNCDCRAFEVTKTNETLIVASVIGAVR